MFHVNPMARLYRAFLHTAISRKVVGKMCTRQSRKVIWDMINTLSWLCSCRTYLCCFPSALANICPRPRVPFYPDFLWRTVTSKSPTIPFGIVACTFSDNLSRNSCILGCRSEAFCFPWWKIIWYACLLIKYWVTLPLARSSIDQY